jgi:TetR/AcrR family transcriptional regulator
MPMSRLDSKQRRAILEAAIAVFAEKGLDGATIRAVGKKAGFNSALIYYYFENKEQLFEEAIRMVVGDFLQMLGRHKRQFAAARERIEFLVNGVFDYYTARPERMRLMITVFSLYCGLLAKILRGFVKEQNVAPLAIIQEGIRLGQIKPFAPIQLWWSLLGMCMFTMQAREIAARLQKEDLPWQAPPMSERRRQVVEILISGLTAGTARKKAIAR